MIVGHTLLDSSGHLFTQTLTLLSGPIPHLSHNYHNFGNTTLFSGSPTNVCPSFCRFLSEPRGTREIVDLQSFSSFLVPSFDSYTSVSLTVFYTSQGPQFTTFVK